MINRIYFIPFMKWLLAINFFPDLAFEAFMKPEGGFSSWLHPLKKIRKETSLIIYSPPAAGDRRVRADVENRFLTGIILFLKD